MCVQEILKCKKEIRAWPSQMPEKMESCIQNDAFRMQYRRVLDFVQTNQAKMEVVLNGERDAPPADLGRLYLCLSKPIKLCISQINLSF